MTYTVSVPATLSNLGPGFDVLGFAIGIHNRFTFEPTGPRGVFLDDGVEVAGHVTASTLAACEARFGAVMPHGVSLVQDERIPRNRGQGSSATARVAGLMAWRHFTGADISADAALGLLAELEGHADNAAPALLGGITAVLSAGNVLRLTAPASLGVVVCVPDVEVSTDAARQALPASYEREDVVRTLGSLAWLMHGLMTADADSLRAAGDDRIHHPYRAPLIGPVDAVLDAARDAGAAHAFISGSGSTLAAFVVDGDAAAVGAAMRETLARSGIASDARVVTPASEGAWTT
jgi:homoserine kinase